LRRRSKRRRGCRVENKEFSNPEIRFPGSTRHIGIGAATAARMELTTMITLNFLPTALLLSCFIFSAGACVVMLADDMRRSRRHAARNFVDVYAALDRIQQQSRLCSRTKQKPATNVPANSGLSRVRPWATVQSVALACLAPIPPRVAVLSAVAV
jgi:hypothetical protein